MKNEFVKPLIVLPLFCLFVSGALAAANVFTKPVIDDAAALRAAEARNEIIPKAMGGFEKIDMEDLHSMDGFPKSIIEVFKTANGSGYIFTVVSAGYGGDIKIMCGIDPDGKIIKTATLDQQETKGMATPILDLDSDNGKYAQMPWNVRRYWGKDRSGIEGIDAKTGATITSNAYKNGIRDIFAAYEIVKNLFFENHPMEGQWPESRLPEENNE